jgi:hypothetical protein
MIAVACSLRPVSRHSCDPWCVLLVVVLGLFTCYTGSTADRAARMGPLLLNTLFPPWYSHGGQRGSGAGTRLRVDGKRGRIVRSESVASPRCAEQRL